MTKDEYKQLYEQVCEQYDVLAKELETIKQALAAPVQEPVAIYQYQLANGSWIDQEKHSYEYNVRHGQATVRIVYTTPPAAQRHWVGLTKEHRKALWNAGVNDWAVDAVEVMLREKNGGQL